MIAESGWQGDAEAAVLGTSELVANALVHAGSLRRLELSLSGSCLRVEVEDPSPATPAPRHPGLAATRGRGIAILERLATSWGYRCRGDGKLVWFELEGASARR